MPIKVFWIWLLWQCNTRSTACTHLLLLCKRKVCSDLMWGAGIILGSCILGKICPQNFPALASLWWRYCCFGPRLSERLFANRSCVVVLWRSCRLCILMVGSKLDVALWHYFTKHFELFPNIWGGGSGCRLVQGLWRYAQFSSSERDNVAAGLWLVPCWRSCRDL